MMKKLKYIKKNLHKYYNEFKEADALERNKQEEERFNKREEMRVEFQKYLDKRQKDYETDLQIRKKLQGFDDEEDSQDVYYKEEWTEEIQEKKEVIIENS